jgi:hypothetical protein
MWAGGRLLVAGVGRHEAGTSHEAIMDFFTGGPTTIFHSKQKASRPPFAVNLRKKRKIQE